MTGFETDGTDEGVRVFEESVGLEGTTGFEDEFEGFVAVHDGKRREEKRLARRVDEGEERDGRWNVMSE